MRISDWSSDVCSSDLVADPAGRADLAATFDDYVITSGLLNGIVSGLVSRSILNNDLVGPNDFHACVPMPEHAVSDVRRDCIETVERAGDWSPVSVTWTADLAEKGRVEEVDRGGGRE